MTRHPTPTLATARLGLSPYTEADRAGFVTLFGQESVTRFMGDEEPLTEADASALFTRVLEVVYPAGSWPVWGVREHGRLVGHAEVKPSPEERIDGWELVYALDPAAWGRGLGTELAEALTAYAHGSLAQNEVHATVAPGNAASLALLARLGYVRLEDLDDDDTLTCHLVHRA